MTYVLMTLTSDMKNHTHPFQGFSKAPRGVKGRPRRLPTLPTRATGPRGSGLREAFIWLRFNSRWRLRAEGTGLGGAGVRGGRGGRGSRIRGVVKRSFLREQGFLVAYETISISTATQYYYTARRIKMPSEIEEVRLLSFTN